MAAVVEPGETDVRHFLLATQAFFFLCVSVCLFINHSSRAETSGISFYGVYHRTLAIIVLGFAVASFGLWRASTYLARAGLAHLSVLGLRSLAAGLVLLLLTPYNKGTFLNWAHMSVGVVMALIQLALAAQLMMLHRSWQAVGAFVIQLFGGIWAGASLPDWRFSYLLLGELIFELGFAWCLVEWTYALFSRRSRSVQVSR
ncbi:MAG TPA: hypothetical protein VGE75_02315 [Acidimicrobiales bacterium]